VKANEPHAEQSRIRSTSDAPRPTRLDDFIAAVQTSAVTGLMLIDRQFMHELIRYVLALEGEGSFW